MKVNRDLYLRVVHLLLLPCHNRLSHTLGSQGLFLITPLFIQTYFRPELIHCGIWLGRHLHIMMNEQVPVSRYKNVFSCYSMFTIHNYSTKVNNPAIFKFKSTNKIHFHNLYSPCPFLSLSNPN